MVSTARRGELSLVWHSSRFWDRDCQAIVKLEKGTTYQLTIKVLDDKKLVLVDSRRKETEFKRVK
jgi:hypothetical protein